MKSTPIAAATSPGSTTDQHDTSGLRRPRRLPLRSCLSVPATCPAGRASRCPVPARDDGQGRWPRRRHGLPRPRRRGRAAREAGSAREGRQGDQRAGLGRERPVRARQRVGHGMDLPRRDRGGRGRVRATRRAHVAASGVGRPTCKPPANCSPRSKDCRVVSRAVGIGSRSRLRGLINVEICAASDRLGTIVLGPVDMSSSMEDAVIAGALSDIPTTPVITSRCAFVRDPDGRPRPTVCR